MNKLQIISIALVVIAVVAFASFGGYKLYEQEKVDTYTRGIQLLQEQLALKLAPLNTYFEQLELNPQTAKALKPKLNKASSILKKAESDIKDLQPPFEYKKKHLQFLGRITMAKGVYNDLFNFSDYLVKRNKYIDKIVADLKYFSKNYNKNKSSDEISKLSTPTATDLNKQLKALKKIKAKQKLLTNKLLYSYIADIEKNLKTLSKAINFKDYDSFYNSIIGIEKSYSQNWSKAFFETDSKELKKLQAKIDEISL